MFAKRIGIIEENISKSVSRICKRPRVYSNLRGTVITVYVNDEVVTFRGDLHIKAAESNVSIESSGKTTDFDCETVSLANTLVKKLYKAKRPIHLKIIRLGLIVILGSFLISGINGLLAFRNALNMQSQNAYLTPGVPNTVAPAVQPDKSDFGLPPVPFADD